MAARRRSSRGGNALVEFSILGVPVLFMTIGIAAVSLNMWEFHNLAYATDATARYLSFHGYDCSIAPNACTMTMGTVAKFFASQGIGLSPSIVNVTFTDASGSTVCNPLNTCNASTAQFPAQGYNYVGKDVTVKASYTLKNPIAMFWPPFADQAHDFTVAATSRQRIAF